jgi:manganese/iron transport system substrate-binding protein
MRARHSSTTPALIAALLVVVIAGGCAAAPGSSGDGADRIGVVTTTTVFADLVANVGGDLVTVTSLVPKNGDVHTYSPRPSDVQAVANAQLLVMNGLGLDNWLEKTISSASRESTPLVKLGPGLSGVELLPGEEPGTENPHLWMDVRYAEGYVDEIVAALSQVDPGHAGTYRSQGDTYKAQLTTLDAWVRQQIATIPPANRKLVTFHDAFPYYAREYGITIVGVAVEAPGQDPSAAYTAQLIDAIRAAGVKAIFSEAQFPAKLMDQIASETGARVVSNLYDGSLGDPPVTSYEAMIRWDTQQLVDALAS